MLHKKAGTSKRAILKLKRERGGGVRVRARKTAETECKRAAKKEKKTEAKITKHTFSCKRKAKNAFAHKKSTAEHIHNL